jgi:hypothetical protein
MKKLLTKASLALTAGAMAVPALVGAEPTGLDPVPGSAGNITVAQLLTKVITWVLTFSAAVAVLFLIFGGLQYVTSAGNEKRIDAAKKTILYAVAGLIVIALSFVIVTFVSRNIRNLVQ